MARRTTRKNGPGDKNKKKSMNARPTQARDTVVSVSQPGGGSYKIKVKTGSPYAKAAKKIGSVPSSFRAGSFTEKTDPLAAGISPAEKKKRMTAYGTKSTYKKSSRTKMK